MRYLPSYLWYVMQYLLACLWYAALSTSLCLIGHSNCQPVTGGARVVFLICTYSIYIYVVPKLLGNRQDTVKDTVSSRLRYLPAYLWYILQYLLAKLW